MLPVMKPCGGADVKERGKEKVEEVSVGDDDRV